MEQEGTVRVVRLEEETSSRPAVYSVSYAYGAGGGALRTRRFHGDEKLIEFLTEIGLAKGRLDEDLRELRREGQVSIQGVRLSDEQIQRYGLGTTSVLDAIRSYLASTSS
jgi:hypothetical protein